MSEKKPRPYVLEISSRLFGPHLAERINRIYDQIITNPILVSVVVFCLLATLVVGMTLYWGYYTDRFRENLLVEAHGVLLDIFILGVVILSLQQKGKNRVEKRRYQDEIDDFRGWESEEAARRVRGSIRRLNKYGVTRMDLSNCFLRSMDLREADFTESYMWGADISWTDMRNTRLSDTNLENANLEAANLAGADLSRSYLWKANMETVDLQQAKLYQTVLNEARLARSDCKGATFCYASFVRADLEEANLFGADLRFADLEEANLTGADLRRARLGHARGITVDRLCQVRTLEGADLDPDLAKRLEEECPHILSPPDEEADW